MTFSLERIPLFLDWEGEMAAMMRRHDWAATPLGPPNQWPQPLKTLTSLMLGSRQPMFMAWGPQRIWFNNDAFIPILGEKHPHALGRPGLEEVWREARDVLAPMFDDVFAGNAVHMDDFEIMLDRHGRLEESHFAFSYNPVRDDTGQVVGLFGTCIEITERVLADRRTNETLNWQRQMFVQAPSFMCILEGPDHVFTFVNNAHKKLFNSENWVGKPAAEAASFAVAQGYVDLLHRVYTSGERYVAQSAPIRYQRAADEVEQTRLLDFVFEPIKDEFGRVIGVFCEGFDVTDARRAEEHRTLLLAELNHRVKNTLAVVQAIARQTLKPGRDLDGLRDAFEGRLAALAVAHDTLTRTNWSPASLREIVQGAVAVCGAEGARVCASGEGVALPPQLAISFSLVLHELCTNALKYGALSNDAGAVEISWRREEGERLILHWRESGGPPVAAPNRRGFGSNLIERALAHELGGRAGIEFRPEGVVCSIEAQL